jgi:hypothetical protein
VGGDTAKPLRVRSLSSARPSPPSELNSHMPRKTGLRRSGLSG